MKKVLFTVIATLALMSGESFAESQTIESVSIGDSTLELALVDGGEISRPILNIKKTGVTSTRILPFEPVKFIVKNGQTFILGKSNGELNIYKIQAPSAPLVWAGVVKDRSIAH